MRTTIDAAGRVVIPKALRDQLGLNGGQEIEVSFRDGHLEIEPVSPTLRLVRRGSIVVAEADSPMPTLTTEQVREILERVRR
jgi:AbrB family looped-hinge helix DNA binding protein